MEFKKKQLSNGLDIISEINKSAKSAAVGFFIRTGARDESKEVSGVSHFLEHMMFKGTDKLSAFEVNEAFDKTGASFNAGTSWENTVYYAAVLPEYLAEVTELWIELMRPSLREDDFNLEKNVIKEEIAMYKDMPSFEVLDKCQSLYFGEHPCGNNILGTKESIDKMSAQQMKNYFSGRYAPNNTALAITGNFEWDNIIAIAEAGCDKWKKQKVERELKDYQGNTERKRIEKANLVREHICLISPAASAQDQRRFAASLLAVITGDAVGSRFYWELVDKALAETAMMQFGPMDGTGVFYSRFCCGVENASKVIDIARGIFDNLSKHGVSENELCKAKNKVLSELVIGNELPMGRLNSLGSNWIYLKEYRTIIDDINSVKAVTVKDIQTVIEDFVPGNFTQFSIGPAKSD